MIYSEIKSCRICDHTALTKVIDFGNQALSTRFPEIGDADAPYLPLTLVMCRQCNLVQLTHDFDLDDLYRGSYGYRSGINQTMTAHLGDIVNQVEKIVNFERNDVVLDIASNDATLLLSYKNDYLWRVGIDPTISLYQEYYPDSYKTKADFFSRSAYQQLCGQKKAKVITSIAMFYDVPNPNDFVSDVHAILDAQGIWVFEQSYLPLLIQNLAFESICHEHLAYYCLRQLENLLTNKRLRIFHAETNEMNGGSLRIFACHQAGYYKTNEDSLNKIREIEDLAKVSSLSTYKKFENDIWNIGELLLKKLKEMSAKGEKVYVYGASTKGNVLLQAFNIDHSIIVAAADRNPRKFGCRTPGSGIPIISEEAARQEADCFFVLPWHFKDEFLIREKDFLQSGGKLLFPLPVPTIATNDGQFLLEEF